MVVVCSWALVSTSNKVAASMNKAQINSPFFMLMTSETWFFKVELSVARRGIEFFNIRPEDVGSDQGIKYDQ
jgi:hypothetical protein